MDKRKIPLITLLVFINFLSYGAHFYALNWFYNWLFFLFFTGSLYLMSLLLKTLVLEENSIKLKFYSLYWYLYLVLLFMGLPYIYNVSNGFTLLSLAILTLLFLLAENKMEIISTKDNVMIIKKTIIPKLIRYKTTIPRKTIKELSTQKRLFNFGTTYFLEWDDKKEHLFTTTCLDHENKVQEWCTVHTLNGNELK